MLCDDSLAANTSYYEEIYIIIIFLNIINVRWFSYQVYLLYESNKDSFFSLNDQSVRYLICPASSVESVYNWNKMELSTMKIFFPTQYVREVEDNMPETGHFFIQLYYFIIFFLTASKTGMFIIGKILFSFIYVHHYFV